MEMSKLYVDRRNYGIDLLRIVSMIYVVILHSLGAGGVLKSSALESSQFAIAWFLEIWAYCAVNMFGIISGYVGYTDAPKRTKYSSYIIMWLQIVFYGVAITVMFNIIDSNIVSSSDLLDMFFPVSNNLYWYFTAYTALFMIMPILNAAIRALPDKQLKIILLGIFIIYVCYDNIFHRFGMESGYSFIWLIVLYLIGGIIKKCNIGKNIKPVEAFFGIIVLAIISWGWKMHGAEVEILSAAINKNLFISYTSPTVVGMAIFHILGMKKISFPKVIKKIIGFLAPGAFAVYIINNQRFIWEYVMVDRFSYLASSLSTVLVRDVLVFSVMFVVISILIDRVRMVVFSILKINYIAGKVSEGIDKVLFLIKAKEE